jgi:hypothetical protein
MEPLSAARKPERHYRAGRKLFAMGQNVEGTPGERKVIDDLCDSTHD